MFDGFLAGAAFRRDAGQIHADFALEHLQLGIALVVVDRHHLAVDSTDRDDLVTGGDVVPERAGFLLFLDLRTHDEEIENEHGADDEHQGAATAGWSGLG